MAEFKRLRYVAARQYGYFTAEQASRTGYSKRAQSYHALSGDWERRERGLYRLRGFDDNPYSEMMRWVLWAQGQSAGRVVAVSHRSALFLHGLTASPPEVIHLTASSLRNSATAPGCLIHWDRLEKDECASAHGLPVTSLLRTVQDLKPDLLFSGEWQTLGRLALERNLLTMDAAELLGLVPGERAVPPVWGMGRGERKEGDMVALAKPGQPAVRRELFSPSQGCAGRARLERTFTLVEMLVVISVVLLLSALLMPSLQNAVEMGRGAKCRGNLRQIYLLFHAYAEDNQGQLPMTRDGGLATWVRRISPGGAVSTAAGEPSLFLCPSDDSGGKISYSINRNAWTPADSGPAYVGLKRLSAFSRPGATFLLLEVQDAIRTYQLRGDGSMVDPAMHWGYGGPWCHAKRGAYYLYVDGHAGYLRLPGDSGSSWSTVAYTPALRFDSWAEWIGSFQTP